MNGSFRGRMRASWQVTLVQAREQLAAVCLHTETVGVLFGISRRVWPSLETNHVYAVVACSEGLDDLDPVIHAPLPT